CINPLCSSPQNSGTPLFCQSCGSPLLLQDIYRVIRPLGGGGFGKTFEVEDCGTPKVLKVLHNTHPKAVELFQKEVEVLSRLNHPGIPKVEPGDYFLFKPRNSPQDLHCLVMEKIEGMDLEKYMQQRNFQPISQKAAFRWLKQLAEILHLVHQQQYFHRDIKPSNIMIRQNGQLALIDFGTAREVTQTYMQKFAGQQVTGIISPGYTPSEQMNGKAVPQSDFFALGRTFVFFLTGQHPNNLNESPLTGELIWRDKLGEVSPDFADFIDYLMKPFPGHRPQDTQTILNSIVIIEQGSDLSSKVPETSSESPATYENNNHREETKIETDNPEYVGILRRFFAGAIDNIILIIGAGFLGKVFFSFSQLPEDIINSIGALGWWSGWGAFGTITEIFGILLMIVLGLSDGLFEDGLYVQTTTFVFLTTILKWFYFARLESWQGQATFGKRLMGVIVTDLNGNRISFGRAHGRYLSKYLSLITLLIGFIMAAFTKKKQALHDKIVETIVVKKKR
ncbi:MAG: protein kinase, partial [Okeania sp. SIO2H7]|nr:protein kinase [Okeania sp. SIO2H7]